MGIQSQFIGRNRSSPLVGFDSVLLGSLDLATVVVVSLLVPVLVGILFQRLARRPRIRDSFVVTSLTISVLAFFDDLLTMGVIRANPVPSPGSPPILFLMEPIEALQSYLLVALPAGLTAGAFILLGASLPLRHDWGWAPTTRTIRGAVSSSLPWIMAGFLSVLPLCAAAVLDVTFTAGLFSSPLYWPLVRSLLTAATVPISAVLGYLSQRVGFGFSLKRSFVLPTIAAFFLYTGFAGVGFGFELFIPGVLFSPTVLFLTATVSLPVALTVGGMTFAASLIAVHRGGTDSSNIGPPP